MDLVTIASETIWISLIPTAMVAGIIALGAVGFIKLRNWIQDNFI